MGQDRTQPAASRRGASLTCALGRASCSTCPRAQCRLLTSPPPSSVAEKWALVLLVLHVRSGLRPYPPCGSFQLCGQGPPRARGLGEELEPPRVAREGPQQQEEARSPEPGATRAPLAHRWGSRALGPARSSTGASSWNGGR